MGTSDFGLTDMDESRLWWSLLGFLASNGEPLCLCDDVLFAE